MEDSYLTISETAEAIYKEKSSKFITYAYHVESEQQVKEILDGLHKRYYDATHHCYAYRIGWTGEQFRANDDGEPSGTAGRPILGQLVSAGVTNIFVVVIRYFGGTKLGVGGLVTAYKESTQAVLEVAKIEERTIDACFEITFDYIVMNDVMKAVKELQPKIVAQTYDNLCTMSLRIRRSKEAQLAKMLENVDALTFEITGYK